MNSLLKIAAAIAALAAAAAALRSFRRFADPDPSIYGHPETGGR